MTITTDSSVTPPNEREKPTVVDLENVTSEKVSPTAALDAERNALLANLPDPDAGKSDEERREIVGSYCIDMYIRVTNSVAGQEAYVES